MNMKTKTYFSMGEGTYLISDVAFEKRRGPMYASC